jgi:acyl-coenzyme A thioesterase PaaI-like protein
MQDHRDARAEAAAHLRAIAEMLVAKSIPEGTLSSAAAALARTRTELESQVSGELPRIWRSPTEDGSLADILPTSPTSGRYHPFAAPMDLRLKEGGVTGTVRYSKLHEGPPGCVHGGVLALLFDTVLGLTAGITAGPAMTGTLEIRYQRPTPLFADLAIETRLVRVEGRKIFVEGTVCVGPTVTASAKGVWIQVDIASHVAKALGKG